MEGSLELFVPPNCLYKGQLACRVEGELRAVESVEGLEGELRRHGQGCQLLLGEDGAVSSAYVGGWNDDLPEGQGRMVYPDGSVYVGEFRAGKRHGHGRITTPRFVYAGFWADDAMHGFGQLSTELLALEGNFCRNSFLSKSGGHFSVLETRELSLAEERRREELRAKNWRKGLGFCAETNNAEELQTLVCRSFKSKMALLLVPMLQAAVEPADILQELSGTGPLCRIDLNALVWAWRASPGSIEATDQLYARGLAALEEGGLVVVELDAPHRDNLLDEEVYWPSLPAHLRRFHSFVDPLQLPDSAGGVLLLTHFRCPAGSPALRRAISRDRFSQLLDPAVTNLAFFH